MWQLQWIFSLIPDTLLNLIYWGIILAGITGIAAGWLGKWIPFYGNYVKILKPTGILLLILGCWLRGGYDVEMAWRDKIAADKAEVERLTQLVKESEKKSDQANRDLEAERKKKVRVVHEVQTVIEERIKEVEKIIDASCKVESEAIKILNDSARNIKGDKQ